MWFLMSLLPYLHNNLHVREHTNHVLLSLLYPLPQRFLVDLQALQLLNLETNKESMVGGAKGGGYLVSFILNCKQCLLEKLLMLWKDDTSYHIASQSVLI